MVKLFCVIIKLNQAVQIESVLSKNVCSEIRAGYETTPTAQARFEEQFPDTCLDWHDIYKLPFNVLIDTKSREFQYRILNRYLTTNSFHKIGLANSPLCTFCKQESESLEHLLPYSLGYKPRPQTSHAKN